MKQTIKLGAKLAAIATLGVSGYASAYDGAVNFQGQIISASCAVDAASTNQTVQLGNISKSSFTGANSTSATKTFSIQLNGCDNTTYKKADVRFDGVGDTNNNNVLKLASGSVATGVGIQLLNADQTPLAVGSESAQTTLATGTNQLSFGARYIQTGATVGAGTANGQAQFSVIYQ
ncbi:fimbrial protein [Paraburkholderia fungorum]|uniref:fimbrial protein n=1 Tax=Paraburkholderia fungorum TaxID=134537 RepID=UPI0038B77D23